METKLDVTKPVQTRDGRKARIICTDLKYDVYPICAIITMPNGNELAASFTSDGRLNANTITTHDLVNFPEKPSYRAWTLDDDIPVPLVLRIAGWPKGNYIVANRVGLSLFGHYISLIGNKLLITDLLRLDCEYTTDGGKTWTPCGVKK